MPGNRKGHKNYFRYLTDGSADGINLLCEQLNCKNILSIHPILKF